MNFFTDQIPKWISLLFLILIFVPVLLIASRAYKAAPDESRKFNRQAAILIIIFYAVYFSAVIFASYQGVFSELSLPPTIIVYTTFPLLAFYLLIIFNLKTFKRIVHFVSVEKLIHLHIFRLIGGFFIILYYFDALPKTFGLIAGCGDVTIALSSLVVAKYYKNQKKIAKELAIIWNTLGLIDIIVTSGMAIYYTKLSIVTGIKGVFILTEIPFCLIPAFAPATIISLHILIYKKFL
ncbi:hypothetical protein [Yeosuana marina]|uniref:hypothetical protein n=1 Tax=Yeosuana marina TaxID=1565536 RepID=UPI00142371B4|nr:hypothetical protein [Yeosuana marina]